MSDRLDAETIAEGVLPSLRPVLRHVTVLDEVDSTNAALTRLEPGRQHAHAILAERQTAGRGRRERHWHSPAGGNVYFSLGWRFSPGDHAFSTLPLVAAIAAANALKQSGLEGHGIKWPNDILVNGRKLVGILAELKSGGGATTAIIGIGINVRMPATVDEDPEKLIDRPWTDLETHLADPFKPCDRNRLASSLLDQLLAALSRLERNGFESFGDDWDDWDLLRDGPLTLQLDEGTVTGVGKGINERGELLLLASDGDMRAFHAGEVRVYRGVQAF